MVRYAYQENTLWSGGIVTFGDLYKENIAFVWRNARRLGVAESDLDDVVQETFLIAYRKLDTYRPHSKPSTWLFGILRNVVRHHKRTLSRRREDFSVERHDKRVSGTDAFARSRSDARLDALSALTMLLERLPEEQLEVFILVELEGMSGPEAGRAIGIPAKTVSSRLRLARERIARIYQTDKAANDGGRR